MKKLFFAILLLAFYSVTNAQSSEKIIHLTKISEIKSILPKGVYLKDSTIKPSKGYYFRYELTNVMVSSRSTGITTGSFSCGGCVAAGACEIKGGTGDIGLFCIGCPGCIFIVEKEGRRYSISGIGIKL